MQLMCLKKPVDAQRNMYIYFSKITDIYLTDARHGTSYTV